MHINIHLPFLIKYFFKAFITSKETICSNYPKESSDVQVKKRKERKKQKETAIFHRDNARAMCCKIDTPEIGKGETGSFVASAVLFRYCFLKLLYTPSNSPKLRKYKSKQTSFLLLFSERR